MALEPEAVVEPRVDPLQRAAPRVAPLPRRAAPRRRREHPPVVRGEVDAHHPAVVPRLRAGVAQARLPPLALQPVRRRRAAVLQRAPVRLEALERHRPLHPRRRAPAQHLALPAVQHVAVPAGRQRTQDRLRRVVVRHPLLLPPQLPDVDQRPHPVGVPQLPLQRPRVQAAVRAEVLAARRQRRLRPEQRVDAGVQHLRLRARRPRHLEPHRQFVLHVRDQVQTVAEPRLRLRPRLPGPAVHAAGLVPPPVRVRVRRLARLRVRPPRRPARHRLAVVAQVPAVARQRRQQTSAQHVHHRRHRAGPVLQLRHARQEPRERPRRRHPVPPRARLLAHRRRAVRAPRQRALRRRLPAQRVEAAQRQQRRVAPQLAQQRRRRLVAEHHPRHQRTPHRRHRVLVPAPAAPRLQRRHDLRVRQVVQHEAEPPQFRQPVDIVPGKKHTLLRRHGVSLRGAAVFSRQEHPAPWRPLFPGPERRRRSPCGGAARVGWKPAGIRQTARKTPENTAFRG